MKNSSEKRKSEQPNKKLSEEQNRLNLDMESLIQEAKIEAQQILLSKKIEAEKIIDDANKLEKIILLKTEVESEELLEKTKKESINIEEQAKTKGYEEGYDIGYKEGYQSGEEASQKLIEESLAIKENYLKEKKSILKKSEDEIIKLVISIYEKVLGQKVKDDEKVIVELVANGIKKLDSTEKLIIISSKEDYETLEKYKDRILAEASLIDELEIKFDINLEKGDSILETPKGSVDISIKKQMKEVKKLLNKILNNE